MQRLHSALRPLFHNGKPFLEIVTIFWSIANGTYAPSEETRIPLPDLPPVAQPLQFGTTASSGQARPAAVNETHIAHSL